MNMIREIKQDCSARCKKLKIRFYTFGMIPIIIRIVCTVFEYFIRDTFGIYNIINGTLNTSYKSLLISLCFLLCRTFLISPLTVGYSRSCLFLAYNQPPESVLLHYYTSAKHFFRCVWFVVTFNFYLYLSFTLSFLPFTLSMIFLRFSGTLYTLTRYTLLVLGVLAFLYFFGFALIYLIKFCEGQEKPLRIAKRALTGKRSRLFVLNLSGIYLFILWCMILPRFYVVPRIICRVKALDLRTIPQKPKR